MSTLRAIHDSQSCTLEITNGLQSDVNFCEKERDNIWMRKITLAKSLVALAVAFVTACGSSGIVSQAIEGGPGQEIVVEIAGVDAGMLMDREGSRDYEVQQVRAFQRDEAHVVDLRCTVALANGDSYFYTFEGPVKDPSPTP